MKPDGWVCWKSVALMWALMGPALLLSGCNWDGIYPVSGRVVDVAGQPIPALAGSQIEFEAVDGSSSSVGEIEADGSFQLTTLRRHDGAPPGKYMVLIARKYIDPERAAPRVILPKYEDYATSELSATVEKKSNTIEFKVESIGSSAARR